MFQQPESTSTSLAASPAPVPAPSDGPVPGPGEGAFHAESTPRIPRWLERLELVLRVMLKTYIGLAFCFAPWAAMIWGPKYDSWWSAILAMFWDKNPLFQQFPTLNVIAAYGAVRGIVSGLGLLNVWIAFQDAIHYKER